MEQRQNSTYGRCPLPASDDPNLYLRQFTIQRTITGRFKKLPPLFKIVATNSELFIESMVKVQKQSAALGKAIERADVILNKQLAHKSMKQVLHDLFEEKLSGCL